MRKRIVSFFLALAMCVSLLPGMASAAAPEDTSWAEEAVTALNEIYGENAFSSDAEPVKVGEVKALLTQTFGYPKDWHVITGVLSDRVTDESVLVRARAADVVCNVFRLDMPQNADTEQFADCDSRFVTILRALEIVSGTSDNLFHPEDPISKAEFAVMFHRTIARVGAITKTGTLPGGFKPGEYGFDEFSFLGTRGCFEYSYDHDNDPATALVPKVYKSTDLMRDVQVSIWNSYGDAVDAEGNEGYTIEAFGKEGVWNAWCERLETLATTVNGFEFDVSLPEHDVISEDATVGKAAITIVSSYRAILERHGQSEFIFRDVFPYHWFYDGVMYLYNNGIVYGTGTGFEPEMELTRGQMAAIICRLKELPVDSYEGDTTIRDMDRDGDQGINENWSYDSVMTVIKEGYMDYTDEYNNFSPTDLVTRQEMAYYAFEIYDGYAESNVSRSVLDRFTDRLDIDEEYLTGVAYCVSAGVMYGTGEGILDPDIPATRAMMGVFFSRILRGFDTSKMHDYELAVQDALRPQEVVE